MPKVIYLDNASTTQVYPEVIKAMIPALSEKYGNPGSPHALGEEAREILDKARQEIAKEINAKAWEIVFTSGATESNFIAVQSVLSISKRNKIIISSFEHASIYENCQKLKQQGFQVVEIPVNNQGIIDLIKLEDEINNNTALVSIIHGNNELGVLQDIAKIGEICKRKGALFHTDAVQTFGKEKIDVKKMNIDLLSASAHKTGGPKGIGILYVKEGLKIHSVIGGGKQERGVRAGTENVAGAVGFAKALEISKKIDRNKVAKIRDYFSSQIEKIGGEVNCRESRRISGHLHVSFPGKDAEMIVVALSGKGIMCSTKSACSEKEKEENRVLKAIGLPKEKIRGSIRFSLNEKIGKKEIDLVVKEINYVISR